MIRKVSIGNLNLTKGNALVCVPVSGKNKEELTRAIEALNKENFDFIEWRIDGLQEKDFREIYSFVKLSLYKIPLLITYRTEKEGGVGAASADDYENIIRALIDLKPEAVDIELSSPYSKELCDYAKEIGVTSVISYHNFEYTNEDADILNKIKEMKATSADVYKLALMPKSFQDTLRVLDLSLKINETDFPSVLISMGDLGKISRVACNQTGTAFTFASSLKGSAPGQMEAGFVKKILSEIK